MQYSLIEFFRAFSQDATPFSPPFHPHLHTNGANTHPIILILNAMLTHKRVVFLGNQMPANVVARIVLAACAFSTGSGQILSGVTESAFPYANLASLDILEQFSGYVAGVTNPRFGDLTSTWDVLCDAETGKVTVSKDLRNGSMGTLKSGRSSESSLNNSFVKVDEGFEATPPGSKPSVSARSDCVDNQFVEDVSDQDLLSVTTELTAGLVGHGEPLWRVTCSFTRERVPRKIRQARVVSGMRTRWVHQDRISLPAVSRRQAGERDRLARRSYQDKGDSSEW